MLEVSRGAVAAGEEELVSCAEEQSKYCSICTVTLDPCGDIPFTSWGRWQCLRGGADCLNGCSAACGCGTEKKRKKAAAYKTRPSIRACRGRGQVRELRATRAGQRAARSEVQKHKPTTAMARERARFSSAFIFPSRGFLISV